LFVWQFVQIAACGSRLPLCDSWHVAHFWWPTGALANSFVWQVLQAGEAAGW
jgi:hypothetical protein